MMEQLVRGSVPWAHPALQPRAPAWHRLSAAAESFGLNGAQLRIRKKLNWSPGGRKIP